MTTSITTTITSKNQKLAHDIYRLANKIQGLSIKPPEGTWDTPDHRLNLASAYAKLIKEKLGYMK